MGNIQRLGFVGFGHMAQAMVKGLVNGKVFSIQNLLTYDIAADAAHKYPRANSIEEVVRKTDGVVIATGPKQVPEVCQAMARVLAKNPDKIVLTMAAGIPTEVYHRHTGCSKLPMVRFMPNKPATEGEGVTGYFINQFVPTSFLPEIERIFKGTGPLVVRATCEDELDKMTAIFGSGPGYVFKMVELLTEKGIEFGFEPEVAARMAKQTILGGGIMAAKSPLSASELCSGVATPGGTTAEAFKTFEAHGFSTGFKAGVDAAYYRSQFIGEEARAAARLQAPGELSIFNQAEQRFLEDSAANADFDAKDNSLS